jgi:hypothetical protein
MRIDIRLFLLAFVGIAGCAGTPPVAPPPPAATQAGPHDASVPTEMNATAENIQALQKAGYKLVNENGQTLYCRTDKKTGSRIRTTTTCLTEEELRALNTATRATMGDIQRAVPPPSGR